MIKSSFSNMICSTRLLYALFLPCETPRGVPASSSWFSPCAWACTSSASCCREERPEVGVKSTSRSTVAISGDLSDDLEVTFTVVLTFFRHCRVAAVKGAVRVVVFVVPHYANAPVWAVLRTIQVQRQPTLLGANRKTQSITESRVVPLPWGV